MHRSSNPAACRPAPSSRSGTVDSAYPVLSSTSQAARRPVRAHTDIL